MMREPARVMIGIPTFNRSEALQRAASSALRQTFADIDVVISDNASTDDTPEVCEDLARMDQRIRIVRHETNVGLTANFNSLLSSAESDYVMILADDDIIDPDWIERCVNELDADPSLTMCSGSARFAHPTGEMSLGDSFSVLDQSPSKRLRSYFANVTDNVTIYGLMRVSAARKALPMKNALAGDWLLCARMLSLGRMRALDNTWLTRSSAGTSADLRDMSQSMEVSRLQRWLPHFAMARLVYLDVAKDHPAHQVLGSGRRAAAARAALCVVRSRPLDFLEDLLHPILTLRVMAPVDRLGRRIVQRARRC